MEAICSMRFYSIQTQKWCQQLSIKICRLLTVLNGFPDVRYRCHICVLWDTVPNTLPCNAITFLLDSSERRVGSSEAVHSLFPTDLVYSWGAMVAAGLYSKKMNLGSSALPRKSWQNKYNSYLLHEERSKFSFY